MATIEQRNRRPSRSVVADECNHFAASQEPKIFAKELRAAFRSLRDEGRSS